MKAAVIVFPGSNCDRDVAEALKLVTGHPPAMVWHKETALPETDLIVLPGGFSHGDYLRSGAIAAQAPIMRSVKARAEAGVTVLGICNGFQILTEAGLLPGGLMRNAGLHFVCRDVLLKVEAKDCAFTRHYPQGTIIRIPVAHHDGNFTAEPETLDRLEGEGLVALRYATPAGEVIAAANRNGSARNIAGIYSENLRVLGLMPHPEDLVDPLMGGTDGKPLFDALAAAS